MFGFKSIVGGQKSIALSLGEKSYSISSIAGDKSLVFSEYREFPDNIPELIAQGLAEDAERLQILGKSVSLILKPDDYQLITMDAMDIPEADMAKALRWRLKGLVDYPLDDIAIDVFPIPPHGVAGQFKKVFLAVTPLSTLKTKISLFNSAYLTVNQVGISELAIRNLVALIPNETHAPSIVMSLYQTQCQILIMQNNQLYLVREIILKPDSLTREPTEDHDILLEIQRSMDYCFSELKLPEVKQIIFMPSFYQAKPLLEFFKKELKQDIILLNLADYFTADESFDYEKQSECYTSIGGALTYNEDDYDMDESLTR